MIHYLQGFYAQLGKISLLIGVVTAILAIMLIGLILNVVACMCGGVAMIGDILWRKFFEKG